MLGVGNRIKQSDGIASERKLEVVQEDPVFCLRVISPFECFPAGGHMSGLLVEL